MRNILIIGSLVLNVFFIGVLAGGHLFGDEDHYGREESDHKRIRVMKSGSDFLIPYRAFESLPENLRDEARLSLREGLRDARDVHRDIMKKREAVAELLRQPDLDEQKIATALDDLHETQARGQMRAADAFIKVLANLPDEERIKLMARVDEERDAYYKKRRKYWKEHDGRHQRIPPHEDKEKEHH